MYRQRVWLYYGGGENLEEGRQAITVEHNGNRLAFIGCNAKGGSFAQAGPKHPGAVKCDLDWMAGEVARLRSAGYLPIVTFQHFEYYTYAPQGEQNSDFHRLAQAGLVSSRGESYYSVYQLEEKALEKQALAAEMRFLKERVRELIAEISDLVEESAVQRLEYPRSLGANSTH